MIEMISIETERLVLRNFVAGDAPALHAMIVQYAASECAAYDHPWPTSPEEIAGVTEWFTKGDHFLAVCLKETGQFIGFVSLNPESGAGGAEFNIGYVFDADYHGRGYATEACRAVLDHAFDRLQARRVITGTAAVNRASCRLLERLGFQKTAAGTTSFRTAADGRPIEFLGYTYALSRDAWQKTGTLE
jgi:RimJ/RimL family protein N-acetyltransferase